MSQVPFGYCVPEFEPRPDVHVLPYTGTVSQLTHAICRGEDPPRRDDRLAQKYGSSCCSANAAEVDFWGFPVPVQNFQKASTMRGQVQLPVESDRARFLPSCAAIDLLTHSQGTRLQPEPARYFSR